MSPGMSSSVSGLMLVHATSGGDKGGAGGGGDEGGSRGGYGWLQKSQALHLQRAQLVEGEFGHQDMQAS